MNWTKTRDVLIAAGIPADRLPEEWRPNIDLRGADLSGADLSGADLRGADLSGASLNWQSHALIAEILFRKAGDDIARRMVAGLVLISRDWCWNQFLAADIALELREWTLTKLAEWVREGDNAPEILAEYARQLRIEQPNPAAVEPATE